jgi:hypothetical protein
MKMKLLAKNEFREMEVEITTRPSIIFQEVELIAKDGSFIKILGDHSWNHLETTSDLSDFYGECFDMKSEEWEINTCYVCKDKSIYFKSALLTKKE